MTTSPTTRSARSSNARLLRAGASAGRGDPLRGSRALFSHPEGGLPSRQRVRVKELSRRAGRPPFPREPRAGEKASRLEPLQQWENGRMNERPTRILVDLDAIAHNLGAIRERVRVPVMGIVKANAYGHGLVPVARRLQAEGVDQLGVAFLEEGIALREAGITLPILVLGGIFGPQVEDYLRHDLEITLSSLDKLRQVEAAAQALGRKAVVHLKIDTGMERIG